MTIPNIITPKAIKPRLYAINRSRVVGSTSISDEPVLAYEGNVLDVLKDLFSRFYYRHQVLYGIDWEPKELAEIENLAVGHDYVVPHKLPEPKQDTFRVRRLPDFAISTVLYDSYAKEPVMITNGRCLLNHESQEGFAATHAHGCIYVPDEAAALRPTVDMECHGRVLLGWTYRKVNAAHLEPLRDPSDIEQQFRAVLDGGKYFGKVRSKRYIGRV